METQTENGTRFRVLTLIDEHTRECLAVHGNRGHDLTQSVMRTRPRKQTNSALTASDESSTN